MTKFKVGDKVRVTKCLHGHGFDIDEVVEIIHHINDYECENNTDSWFLRDTEFELYEEKETEMALTCTMNAEQIRDEILRIDARIKEAKKDIENAEKERNSLVEKLNEKGFALIEEIPVATHKEIPDTSDSKDVTSLDEVVVGTSYIVTNKYGMAEPYMVGKQVVVRCIDYSAYECFIQVESEDGQQTDWMHYEDLARI